MVGDNKNSVISIYMCKQCTKPRAIVYIPAVRGNRFVARPLDGEQRGIFHLTTTDSEC